MWQYINVQAMHAFSAARSSDFFYCDSFLRKQGWNACLGWFHKGKNKVKTKKGRINVFEEDTKSDSSQRNLFNRKNKLLSLSTYLSIFLPFLPGSPSIFSVCVFLSTSLSLLRYWVLDSSYWLVLSNCYPVRVFFLTDWPLFVFPPVSVFPHFRWQIPSFFHCPLIEFTNSIWPCFSECSLVDLLYIWRGKHPIANHILTHIHKYSRPPVER